jgi:hypothetical protein
MLAGLALCIAAAASQYAIPQEMLLAAVGVTRADGIGITGIPRQWLPYLRKAGFKIGTLATDDCQNVIAAGWILGYTQKLRQAEKAANSSSEALPDNAKQWQPAIQWISAKAGLSTALVNAVIEQESHFHPEALGPRTKSGERAVGLMQILPSTARALGVNPRVPLQNIWGGTWYLSNLVRYYGGDVSLALAAYNAGQGAVAKYGGIPPYRETRQYVPTILHRAARYASLN